MTTTKKPRAALGSQARLRWSRLLHGSRRTFQGPIASLGGNPPTIPQPIGLAPKILKPRDLPVARPAGALGAVWDRVRSQPQGIWGSRPSGCRLTVGVPVADQSIDTVERNDENNSLERLIGVTDIGCRESES